MTGKPATIKDVAKLAQVSPATVSNVFSGRKPVDKTLANRVRKAAKALNYEPDRAASQLRSGKTRIVAMLVPDLNNPFFTSIVAAVEGCLQEEGYEFIVSSSNGDEAIENSRLAAMLAWRPAGLVVIPSADAFPGQGLLERSAIPYVVADRLTENHAADTVGVDNEAAGALGAAHFVELGHEKILIAASALDLANMRGRCAGAARVLEQHGMPEPEIIQLGHGFEEAVRRLSRRFEQHGQPTAVLALTNVTTLAVLTALAERRIAMPGELSLIGFDDYAWMRARFTPLTAISQPVREIGKAIWELLSARIEGDQSPPRRVELSCELMVRSSVARLRGPASEDSPRTTTTSKDSQERGPPSEASVGPPA